jgi:hypothetical protein
MSAVYTIFTLLRSETDSTTGDIRFTTVGDLTPANVTDCTIETEDSSELIEVGNEPEIIPMGIGGCTATVSGTFFNPLKNVSASNVFDTANLAKEIKQFYDQLKLYDKISDKEVQYALRISPANKGGTRELEGGIWKIKRIMMDRSLKDGGKYKFNMQLSYFWEDKSEQMLYVSGTGTAVRQTCAFKVKIIGTGNGQSNAEYEIFSTKIVRSLHVLNNARFDCEHKILKDSVVKIRLRGSADNNSANIFWGVVDECESNPRDGAYTIRCKEIGDLLYRNIVGDPLANLVAGSDLFKNLRVIIPNKKGIDDISIQEMVQAMLNTYYKAQAKYAWSPGTGVCRAPPLGGHTTLPGRDDIQIGTQVISGSSVGTALTNFLYHECGFYTWYNYENGKFEYGFIRDKITLDLSKEIILKSSMIDDNQEDVKPDYVVVWDPDVKYKAIYGTYGIDKQGIQYVLRDAREFTSASALAKKIYDYCNLPNKSSYNVEFPAGTTRFKEGDYFSGLGDQTLSGGENMEWRGGTDANPMEEPGDSVWHIKEIIISEEGTTVEVGTSFYSVLDIYKDSLSRRRDGIPAPTTTSTQKTETVRVGKEVIT